MGAASACGSGGGEEAGAGQGLAGRCGGAHERAASEKSAPTAVAPTKLVFSFLLPPSNSPYRMACRNPAPLRSLPSKVGSYSVYA